MKILGSIWCRFFTFWKKNKLLLSPPQGTKIARKGLIVDGWDNLNISDHVYIGPNALIYCKNAKVRIQSKVVIGPGISIISGDHNYSEVGIFLCDQHNKRPEDDKEIVIQSDVWIGCNVTILKGVTIGRGSVVAAGAVVTKSCPPYSIIGGVPARILKQRFSPEQIYKHETIIYGKEKNNTP